MFEKMFFFLQGRSPIPSPVFINKFPEKTRDKRVGSIVGG
jgi:hypothetical protein